MDQAMVLSAPLEVISDTIARAAGDQEPETNGTMVKETYMRFGI